MQGDWIGTDGHESLLDGGHRWTIRPSETGEGLSALFRLPEGRAVPEEGFPTAEEEFGFGVFRSAAEARLAAAVAVERRDPSQIKALLDACGFKEGHSDGPRKSWLKSFDGGSLSLYQGGDEDDRDVVGQMNLVTRPGEISFLMVLSHGKGDLPFPDEPQAALGAALALVAILDGANHLAAPLSDADWEAYRSGEGITALPQQVRGHPAAWQFIHAVLKEKPAGESRAILDQARAAADEGLEAGVLVGMTIDALTAYLANVPPEYAGRLSSAFIRDPEACYAISAAHHGIEAVQAALTAESAGIAP